MVEIIVGFFRMNFKNSIFQILLLSVLFFLMNISTDEIKLNITESNYINYLDDSMKLYPSGNMQLSQKIFSGKVNNRHVGYIRESIVQNDETSESNACWMVNEFYMKQFIFQIEGNPLDYHSGERQVLLYGNKLKNEYAIGDNIYLEGVEYTVVGYIPASQPLYSFNYTFSDIAEGTASADIVKSIYDLNNKLQYPLNGGMYLVNDTKGWDNISESVAGFAVDSDYSGKVSEDGISMEAMKAYLKNALHFRSRFHSLYFVFLSSMGIFVLLSISVIQYKKCSSWFGVFRLCGMSSWKYHFMCVSIWCFDVLCSFIINLFITCIFCYAEDSIELFVTRMQILGILGGSSIVILCSFNLFLSRKAIVEVLKGELS